jgi:small subunit ribosomal protein S17
MTEKTTEKTTDAARSRRKIREDRVKHRLYGKVLRQTSRLKAHDEQNAAAIGDRVRVMETRPLSATKRWRLVEIIEKAK